MPRYAILTHDHPFPHWDFLLELVPEGPLATWRLLSEPGAGRRCLAEALPEHRRIYLDYEGPVSGGRGTVTRWDGGVFTIETDRPGELSVKLAGDGRMQAAALRSSQTSLWWEFT